MLIPVIVGVGLREIGISPRPNDTAFVSQKECRFRVTVFEKFNRTDRLYVGVWGFSGAHWARILRAIVVEIVDVYILKMKFNSHRSLTLISFVLDQISSFQIIVSGIFWQR